MHTLRTREASSWRVLSSEDATRWPPSLLAILHSCHLFIWSVELSLSLLEGVCTHLGVHVPCRMRGKNLNYTAPPRRTWNLEPLLPHAQWASRPDTQEVRCTDILCPTGADMKEEDGDDDSEPRTLVVRAQDGETIMGEDLVLPVTGDETVVQIQEVRF